MFDSLSSRLGDVFDKLRRRGALSEDDVTAALRDVRVALLEADVGVLRASLEERGVCELEVDGQALELSPGEIEVDLAPREGYVARSGEGMVLVLETAVDEGLVGEWWAREVVACVNSLRGERGLAYEARIELKVACGGELRTALEAREEYLKGETLALSVEYSGEEGAPGGKEGKAGELAFSIDFTLSE